MLKIRPYAIIQLKSSDSSSSNQKLYKEDCFGRSRTSQSKEADKGNIITVALTMGFDQSNIFVKNAVYVLTGISRALTQNVEELNINRSTIHCEQTKHCAKIADKLKAASNTG